MAKKPAIVPRKPSKDIERDKFVSGSVLEAKRVDAEETKDVEEPKRSVAQEPKRSSAQEAKRSGARKPKGEGRLVFVRADGREIKKVSVYFAKETAKRLAVYCAHAERDMSAVVNELVATHLPKLG